MRFRHFFFVGMAAVIAFLLVGHIQSQENPSTGKARNIILFIGDGTGIPTLNAASIHGYGEPRKLYLQRMPAIALMETSAANSWVSDSAAGMTAIMTGHKTNNGVISQSKESVRGEKDGAPLKTLLEYAEERGLSTGVVSNSPMSDATPAACYAHSNDRAKHGYIFAQILKPAFGNGVDVVIGPGRDRILKETGELGVDLPIDLKRQGYAFVETEAAMEEAAAQTDRLIALYESSEYRLAVSVEKALDILTRNPKGFFLMVESNNHSTNVPQTLSRAVEMDRIIERTAERMAGTDTLILFTADHSYALRIGGGSPRTQDILERVVVADAHTAEEVLVAAQGPGSERVRGILENTELFHVMKAAFGW